MAVMAYRRFKLVKPAVIVGTSGKGGTGKTTFLALSLKKFLEKENSILVIDADPAANMGETLGVRIEKTLGSAIDELRLELHSEKVSPEITKRELIEGRVHKVLFEAPKFDLLAMGALERKGCFCIINTLLTEIVDKLSSNYELVLMDMPAGLEHVTRRTSKAIDIMYILSDASKMALESAGRIVDLAKKVNITFKKTYLVGNRIENLDDIFKSYAENHRIVYAGSVPNDPEIQKYNLLGKSLLEIPESSSAYKAVAEIIGSTCDL